MYEEEFHQISAVIEKLLADSNARAIVLIDKNGQLIANSGAVESIDMTSLASLTAGNIAATGGQAKLIGEDDFSTLFHEGDTRNIHITTLADRIILFVLFDQNSSLGLVRLRVKKANAELTMIFQSLVQKAEQDSGLVGGNSPFSEITDDDIDNLFSE